MQGIEFEDDKNLSGLLTKVPVQSAKPSFMMGILAKIGVIDKTTANFILLGVAAAGLGVTIFLYAGLLSEPAKDWSRDTKAIMEMQRYR